MNIRNYVGKLSSTWYFKPIETGLIMNFHVLAPKKSTRAVVAGFVHQIYRACSVRQTFDEILARSRIVLKRIRTLLFLWNVINDTLNRIVKPKSDSYSRVVFGNNCALPDKSDKFCMNLSFGKLFNFRRGALIKFSKWTKILSWPPWKMENNQYLLNYKCY